MTESPEEPRQEDEERRAALTGRRFDPREHFTPRSDPEHIGKEASASARLFDLRLLIGGLFVVYGVLLIIYSFFDSAAEIAKSAGIHLNLWLGIVMLVVGALFIVWARLQPQKPAAHEEADTTAHPTP